MADALLGFGTLLPHFGVTKLAIDRRDQPVEVVLDDVVVGAVLHGVDRDLFADRARYENEWYFEAAVTHHGQRRGAAETRHRVVRDHHVPVVLIQGCGKRLFAVDAGVVRLVSALPQVFNEESRVVLVILDQQQSQRSHAGDYRAIQAVVNCSAFASCACTPSATVRLGYLPTRTRKSFVGAPCTGSITNAG